MGEELIPVFCHIFSFNFVYLMQKAIVFYESDKRKIQEICEILARKLYAGKRARSHVHRHVCSTHAGLRVVGYPRILTRADHQSSR